MIYFKKTGVEAENIEGKSILEIAALKGVKMQSLCKKGLCGTCKTKMLSGEVEMKNPFALFKNEKEEGIILTCIAHAKGDVVLDV
ncbi:MAG: hypothetical protein COB67_06110 [SAR324 cluster bacterium]|uniref:2Fe-2S ferredoxin-type domain-containing protein n=1 Tax=SAR324 cluster bacterium TaxID=2024889 RepID=A0A2A4T5J7_9DELT|nr:MAG: hypothetical protein COB67_06110 [SAR324 cluster bacterium]